MSDRLRVWCEVGESLTNPSQHTILKDRKYMSRKSTNAIGSPWKKRQIERFCILW